MNTRTDAELVLADVLAGILGLDSGYRLPLGRDFISLGGDSIGALTAAGRLRHRGYGIRAKDLLAGTELADVAAAAEQVTSTPPAPSPPWLCPTGQPWPAPSPPPDSTTRVCSPPSPR